MKAVTIRIPEDTYRTLEDEADETDRSTAAVIRERIEKGVDYDDLEAERDRLQRELSATNQRIDDTNEIVEYVQEERELQQQRRQKENAPAWQRAKYWVFGFSDNN